MSIGSVLPKKNEIAFKWFNTYAGVAITTPTKNLVIDPVEVKVKDLADVDAVLITHEHYDHLDGRLVRRIHEQSGCQVLADPMSTRKLESWLPEDKLLEMSAGMETEIDDVKVKAERCNHPPATSPITFLVTSGDGVTVFHTADSMPFPEMEEIGKTNKPDLVFCTVGIAPGATPRSGFEITRLTKPKVAVPYHTAQTSDLTTFCKMLNKEMPAVKCHIPQQGSVYIVGKEKRK